MKLELQLGNGLFEFTTQYPKLATNKTHIKRYWENGIRCRLNKLQYTSLVIVKPTQQHQASHLSCSQYIKGTLSPTLVKMEGVFYHELYDPDERCITAISVYVYRY